RAARVLWAWSVVAGAGVCSAFRGYVGAGTWDGHWREHDRRGTGCRCGPRGQSAGKVERSEGAAGGLVGGVREAAAGLVWAYGKD
ncbi:MAG: hypothetical protein OXJ55_22075, partial [Caldilineaceae bacterium]|nr:hypothetical protein [Caldilineaceae bacterium]